MHTIQSSENPYSEIRLYDNKLHYAHETVSSALSDPNIVGEMEVFDRLDYSESESKAYAAAPVIDIIKRYTEAAKQLPNPSSALTYQPGVSQLVELANYKIENATDEENGENLPVESVRERVEAHFIQDMNIRASEYEARLKYDDVFDGNDNNIPVKEVFERRKLGQGVASQIIAELSVKMDGMDQRKNYRDLKELRLSINDVASLAESRTPGWFRKYLANDAPETLKGKYFDFLNIFDDYMEGSDLLKSEGALASYPNQINPAEYQDSIDEITRHIELYNGISERRTQVYNLYVEYWNKDQQQS